MATVSVGTPKVLQNCTISLSGFSATTTYNVNIVDGNSTERHTVTTDGSGAASVTYVPQHGSSGRTVTINVVQSTTSTAGTTTATHSGN